MSTGPLVDLVARLFPFDYSVTGAGNEAAARVMQRELPFTVFEYPSGRDLNGWTIPPALSVERAVIRCDGETIADLTATPLGVAAQSDSFSGRLSREELRQHLFGAEGDPAATPYHWSRLYRPHDTGWGLCLPQQVIDGLAPGAYDVELVTRKTPASMQVLVHELPGASPDTIVFNAHNCHPYQANDDVSGIAVGIELMRRLARLPARRLTYQLVVAPELFGPLFWLDEIGEAGAAPIKAAVMLKSVGNDRPLRLQESFTGSAAIDLAAHVTFRSRYGGYESGSFRTIYGNDETVFEAPPYCIPAVALTRWPFPEYHTDRDVPARLSEARLEDTVAAAFEMCTALEMDITPIATAKGLVCLSRHGLYKPVPPVGPDGVDYGSPMGRWNRLMNTLPRLMDGRTSLLQIAHRFELPIADVHEYVRAWMACGLATEGS